MKANLILICLCNGPLRNWTKIKEKNFNFRHEFEKKDC